MVYIGAGVNSYFRGVQRAWFALQMGRGVNYANGIRVIAVLCAQSAG